MTLKNKILWKIIKKTYCLSIVWKNHSVNRRSCWAAACDSSCSRRLSSLRLRTSSLNFLTSSSTPKRRRVSRDTRDSNWQTVCCNAVTFLFWGLKKSKFFFKQRNKWTYTLSSPRCPATSSTHWPRLASPWASLLAGRPFSAPFCDFHASIFSSTPIARVAVSTRLGQSNSPGPGRGIGNAGVSKFLFDDPYFVTRGESLEKKVRIIVCGGIKRTFLLWRVFVRSALDCSRLTGWR